MKKLSEQLSPELLNALKDELVDLDKEEPCWLVDNQINEVLFAKEYLEKQPLRCLHGSLYSIDGYVPDETIKSNIFKAIKDYMVTGVDKKIENLLKVIKISCQVEDFSIDTDKIHFNNGTYSISEGFSEHKQWTLNRLPVSYNPDASEPKRWLKFLNELLDKDDIPTLQEFMGYCLIPCTKAQTMLLIIGKGGEGKSRIGVVLRYILGINMNTGSLKKLETNRFCLADQENKLLLFDDDLAIEALPSTNVIKSVVTAEGKTDMEHKGKQSYQGVLYVRLMGLGNGALKSLYDKSLGFYRRQIILTTKDKPTDRVIDKNLSDKLLAEIDGIVLWCIEGLLRLIDNGFEFTVSDKAKKTKEEMICENNNIVSFLSSTGYICFGKDLVASSKKLYEAYCSWAFNNAEKPVAQVSFFKYLSEHATELGIEPVKNLHLENKKSVRGYRGIEVPKNIISSDDSVIFENTEILLSNN